MVNRRTWSSSTRAVKFPPLWSRKATPPAPVEAYRDQPGNFPRVWGFKDYDWIEWTIDTDTVMERNFTETLGAGATVCSIPNRPARSSRAPSRFRTCTISNGWPTISTRPQWPAAIFGEIKPDLAAAGGEIFKNLCARCHEYGDDRRTPTGLIELNAACAPKRWAQIQPRRSGSPARSPIPARLRFRRDPTASRTSQLLKDCAGVKAGEAFSANPFAKTVQVAVDSIKQKAFAAAGIGVAQQRAMEDLDQRGGVAWRDTLIDTQPPYGPYAARPLYGIWAAAPYLHNGSVPTLYHLLLPPDQRPKTFALGARDYDPVKLGFVVNTLQPAGLSGRHERDRRWKWRPPLGYGPIRVRSHGASGIPQDLLTTEIVLRDQRCPMPPFRTPRRRPGKLHPLQRHETRRRQNPARPARRYAEPPPRRQH